MVVSTLAHFHLLARILEKYTLPVGAKPLTSSFEDAYLLVNDVVAVSFTVPYARWQAVLLRSPLHRSEFLPRLYEIPFLVLVVVRPRDDVVVVCTTVFFVRCLSQKALLFSHALFVLLQESSSEVDGSKRVEAPGML